MSVIPLSDEGVENYKQAPELVRSKLTDTLRRIRELNPIARCFTQIWMDERAIERYCSEQRDSALFGVTVAVKDCIEVQGRALSWGIKPLILDKAEQSGEFVRLLEKHGALIIGATNLDPLCLNFIGRNPYFGDVINPENKERIILGSSCGSACAVSLKLCDFALGTDMGGSLRAPAASCAISSLVGGLSMKGVRSLAQSFDNLGLLAQGLRELVWLYGRLFGSPERSECKLYVPSDSELEHLSPEIKESWRLALIKLNEQFEIVQLKQKLGFSKSASVRKILITHEIATNLRMLELKELPKEAQAIVEKDKELDQDTLKQAAVDRIELSNTLEQLLKDGSFILAPVLPCPPPSRSKAEALNRATLLSLLMLLNTAKLNAISFPVADNLSLQALAGEGKIGGILDALQGTPGVPC